MLSKGFTYKHENIRLEKMHFYFSPPYKNFNMSAIHQKITKGLGPNNLVRQVRYEFNNKTRMLTIVENQYLMIGKVVKITYIVSNQEERKLKLNKIDNASR